ncbi:MAG: hypothetical protein HS115_19530 [Spirochaetales bacterium]|nr:hypothetical protein [Spirochaetales bacterium]
MLQASNSLPSIVVGSGPASAAAIEALCKAGEPVLVVDAGLDLEPEYAALKVRLAAQDPADWDPLDLERWKGHGRGTSIRGVDSKTASGSNFANEVPAEARPQKMIRARMARSYSLGGLSNVWGASILPHHPEDLSDWPVPFSELQASYQAVLDFLPQAAWPDSMTGLFLPEGDVSKGLKAGAQIQKILENLEKKKDELARDGIFFGQSRLAVDNRNNSCRYCGLCMYGCPYDLIYSSRQTLEKWNQGGVDYRPGHLVHSFREEGLKVLVQGTLLNSGKPFQYEGKRLYLGAGVLETARITLQSFQLKEVEWPLRHSDIFLMPVLQYRRTKGAMNESAHQLTQLFLELRDRATCDRFVHLQLYGYNDLYRQALERLLGPLYLPLQGVAAAFLERLLMVFGYIHSDDSSHLTFKLNANSPGTMLVQGYKNNSARKIARRIRTRMLSLRRELGGIPLWPRLGLPGYGNHSGCSFPMSRSPGEKQSDILGRPMGLKRVHLIDASSLPSLPATTITLTVMANAHRIASAAARIE